MVSKHSLLTISGAKAPTKTPKVGGSAKKAKKTTAQSRKHTMIGRGLCRGLNWQSNNWPQDEGFETLEDW